MKLTVITLAAFAFIALPMQGQFDSDVIPGSGGDLEVFFIGHGSLMFKYNDQVIHIDPVMMAADYSNLPDADLILVSHQHGDHLDLKAINHLLKDETSVLMTRTCLEQLEDFTGIVMENGDKENIKDIGIWAIPAYNIKHVRSNGNPYHPKGEGNGYILTFGSMHVLIGGDTENIPEYKDINQAIDVAFLPMNTPYTMTPEMVADAALTLRPRILYPYHFGRTDTRELVKLLKDEQEIEVRIRDLK
jgi:L-ascorbate metabolism protein UlaG (beta-lactamase superfamily)